MRTTRETAQSTMSLRQFARAMDVNDRAVRKAIRSGKIPQDVLGSEQHGQRTYPVITDPERAAKIWVEQLRPMPTEGRPVDYATLPEGVRQARMLRDLRQAKWYEERAREAARAKAGRNAININELKLILHSVGQGVIDSAGAGRDEIRKVTRTVVAVFKNKVAKQVEEKVSGKHS